MQKSSVITIIVAVALIAGGLIYWYALQGPSSSPATYQATSTPNTPSAFLPDSTSSADVISTVPPNGDVNPYGIAFVPADFPSGGKLNPGDILVSNFNNKKNLQGTGTTIVRIAPSGQQSVFFQGKAPLGLTTALVVLRSGFVMVGNLPTTDGTSATAKAGSLLLIDKNGKLLTTLTDSLINGPWDMAVNDNGADVQAFVSNVLSGSVVRFDFTFGPAGVTSRKGTVIASGYAHKGDPSALEIGPTGLAYDAKNDLLFVAATADNAIFSIANAKTVASSTGMGSPVYGDQQYLHGPLAIIQAPNGNFLVANGDAVNADPAQPSEIIEITPAGSFVKQLSLDPNPGGAFGLDIAVSSVGVARLAAVNDNSANLLIWTAAAQ